MEERLPATRNSDIDPPIRPSPNDNTPPPGGITPGEPTGTYVITVPRDQVYRVPQPENANIVETYRNPSNDVKNACGRRLLFTFLGVILLGVALILTINHFSRPKSPEFSVNRFGRKDSKPLTYEVSLRVFNVNEKSHIGYRPGNVTLEYKGREIATGESQLDHQGDGIPMDVDQILHGTKETLPEEVVKSMNDEKLPKVLILKIDVTIEITTWDNSLKKEMSVRCDLEVDSLTSQGAKILNQKCVTD